MASLYEENEKNPEYDRLIASLAAGSGLSYRPDPSFVPPPSAPPVPGPDRLKLQLGQELGIPLRQEVIGQRALGAPLAVAPVVPPSLTAPRSLRAPIGAPAPMPKPIPPKPADVASRILSEGPRPPPAQAPAPRPETVPPPTAPGTRTALEASRAAKSAANAETQSRENRQRTRNVLAAILGGGGILAQIAYLALSKRPKLANVRAIAEGTNAGLSAIASDASAERLEMLEMRKLAAEKEAGVAKSAERAEDRALEERRVRAAEAQVPGQIEARSAQVAERRQRAESSSLRDQLELPDSAISEAARGLVLAEARVSGVPLTEADVAGHSAGTLQRDNRLAPIFAAAARRRRGQGAGGGAGESGDLSAAREQMIRGYGRYVGDDVAAALVGALPSRDIPRQARAALTTLATRGGVAEGRNAMLVRDYHKARQGLEQVNVALGNLSSVVGSLEGPDGEENAAAAQAAFLQQGLPAGLVAPSVQRAHRAASALRNAVIQARSGAQVTQYEFDNIMEEMQMGRLGSAAGLREFIDTQSRVLRNRYADISGALSEDTLSREAAEYMERGGTINPETATSTELRVARGERSQTAPAAERAPVAPSNRRSYTLDGVRGSMSYDALRSIGVRDPEHATDESVLAAVRAARAAHAARQQQGAVR